MWIGGTNMPNEINMMDIETLKELKSKLACSTSKEETLTSFLSQYQNCNKSDLEQVTEVSIYNINLGNRTESMFHKRMHSIRPYSSVQNSEAKKAQGDWEVIYNIAYPNGETTIIRTEIEKSGYQKIIDKAA